MTQAPKGQPTLAEQADRHALYQQAVQDVVAEIDFVQQWFETLSGRPARLLREDFCGTGNTSCEWVRRRSEHQALGLDLDEEVLAWGRQQIRQNLNPEQQQRIELLHCDVRTPPKEPVDMVLAMNFSYYLFPTREAMRAYFSRVRQSLVDDGVFFLDAYGGYDAPREIEESRDCGDFTYIWEQADYDPVSGMMDCNIHFTFPDGSRLDKAFTYRWRLWTLPELRELLAEAGFRDITVYWEGTDEATGEGNGLYEPCQRGDADAGWICYLSARPG